MLPRAISYLLVVFCLAASTQAADKAAGGMEGGMVTDRPGFSESAAVVGAGMLQWESGFQFGRMGMDGERTTATVGPYPLLRLGVSRRVEFRFTGDGYRRERRGGEAVRGLTDFVVGGKVKVAEQGRWMPDVAVLGNVGAVRGSRQYARAGWEPEVKLCAEKDVAGGMVLGANFNVSSLLGERGRSWERAHSLTVGHALGGAWSGFVETYSQRIDRAHGYATAVDGGVTHPVGRHAQVDAYVGRTVRGARAEWFIGVGFSVQQSLLPMLRR